MTKDELRLECLKLAYRHDHEAQQIVERAKVFEKYLETDIPEKVHIEVKKVGKR